MKRPISFICIISLLFTACIQVGGQQQLKYPVYQDSTATQGGGGSLSPDRAPGEYYTQTNAKRNQHLPKGKPYKVRGETYVPYTATNGFMEIGIASWYGPGFHGKTTANGERYDQYVMTAAHKLLPFGTLIKVTNLENGKTCIVRINDRGPFLHDRVIDLSNKAAEAIAMINAGTAKVKLEVAGSDVSSRTPLYLNNNASQQTQSSIQNNIQAPIQSNIQAPIQSNIQKTVNAPATTNNQIYLHLRAYSNYNNAQDALGILRKGGVNAQIFKDHGMYFVQTGPHKNLQDATKIKTRLQKHFPKSYYVLR